jgi:hypothetical protein
LRALAVTDKAGTHNDAFSLKELTYRALVNAEVRIQKRGQTNFRRVRLVEHWRI